MINLHWCPTLHLLPRGHLLRHVDLSRILIRLDYDRRLCGIYCLLIMLWHVWHLHHARLRWVHPHLWSHGWCRRVVHTRVCQRCKYVTICSFRSRLCSLWGWGQRYIGKVWFGSHRGCLNWRSGSSWSKGYLHVAEDIDLLRRCLLDWLLYWGLDGYLLGCLWLLHSRTW